MKSTSSPLVQCSRCTGSGKVKLAPLDLETYRVIGMLGETTIPEVSLHMKVPIAKRSIVNHSIKRLVDYGIVTKIKQTRKFARYRQRNGE